MKPLTLPPSPHWGEEKGEGKFRIYLVEIDLTFACLREAAPAKAGILAFDIHAEWYKDSCVIVP